MSRQLTIRPTILTRRRQLFTEFVDGQAKLLVDTLAGAGAIPKHSNPQKRLSRALSVLLSREFKLPVSSDALLVDPVRMKNLLTRLDDMHFSVRAKRGISSEGSTYVCELVQKKENDLLLVKHFTRTVLKEVKLSLEAVGLSFGMVLTHFELAVIASYNLDLAGSPKTHLK